jgi:hypothetical protein
MARRLTAEELRADVPAVLAIDDRGAPELPVHEVPVEGLRVIGEYCDALGRSVHRATDEQLEAAGYQAPDDPSNDVIVWVFGPTATTAEEAEKNLRYLDARTERQQQRRRSR